MLRIPGVTGTLPARDGLLRAAAYVTMAPAQTAVKEVLDTRKACIAEGWASGSGGWCAHRVITSVAGGAGSVDHATEKLHGDDFKEAPRCAIFTSCKARRTCDEYGLIGAN
jgi:hypothetical protein